MWLSMSACTGADLVLGDGRSTRPDAADAAQAMPSLPDFGAPSLIAELESDAGADDDPSLTGDLLGLCFNSKRSGGLGEEDIWCSRRAGPDEAWGRPEPQVQLNSEHRETGIALALDGLTVWFSSDRDGGPGGLDVYVSSRPSLDEAWSTPTLLPELSSSGDDLVSALDETGRSLWLAQRERDTEDDDDPARAYDIMVAERLTPGAAWQPPQPVPELNTEEAESDAFPIGAGLALIYSRGGDLILTTRRTLDAPFEPGEPMHALNSDHDERDAWTNSAFDYIVFSSDRAGSHRLYEASRSIQER